MTVKERASALLISNPARALCDRCLARTLGVDPSTGHRAATKISRSDDFRREWAQCSDCRETRFVTRSLR